MGAPITEDDQVATLLCVLPDSYSNLIIALESRADELTMEFLVAILLHEEHKGKDYKTEKAMVPFKGKPKEQFESKSYVGKTSMKNKGRCYNFDLYGHFAKDCHRPKTSNKFLRQREHANSSACTRSDDINENVLFMMS